MPSTDTLIQACDLYKIILTGDILGTGYFTSYDKDIAYNGATYVSIPITRSDIEYHSDLQVDTVDVTFGIVLTITIGSKAWTIPELVSQGLLDNAHLYIYNYDYGNATLSSIKFEGYLTGDRTYNMGSITCSFGSILDKLQENYPKLIFSEFCNHQIFDSYCGLATGDYVHIGTCATASSATCIYSNTFASTTQSVGYWDSGELKITSGNNNLIRRDIKQHYDGRVVFDIPFGSTFASGDNFRVYPGCNGLGTTCQTKFVTIASPTFSNYSNFLGFEDIPLPEVIYG